MYCCQYLSPVGRLSLVSDGISLTEITIDGPVTAETGECAVLRQAQNWLDAYFGGEARPPEMPLSPRGTEFQQRVWAYLQTIPFGSTCTYGEIAREIGCRSAQAVGQAVGANPIAIMIPCHRCVGAGGKLTGYAWGIEKKEWLRNHERRNCI